MLHSTRWFRAHQKALARPRARATAAAFLAACVGAAAAAAATSYPWSPPPADSPGLLASLRNTSMPKLAYSTYIGWYEDGGLNETSLWQQAEAIADLRVYGWTHLLHGIVIVSQGPHP